MKTTEYTRALTSLDYNAAFNISIPCGRFHSGRVAFEKRSISQSMFFTIMQVFKLNHLYIILCSHLR